MNKSKGQLIVGIFVGALSFTCNADPRCSEEALTRAKALLSFHLNGEDGDVAQEVKALAPIRNPANPKQELSVLEVWGFFYKGKYRMHFIFSPPSAGCTLLGEEILEYAKL